MLCLLAFRVGGGGKWRQKTALREPSDNYSKGMGSRGSVLSDREAWQLASEYQKQRESENWIAISSPEAMTLTDVVGMHKHDVHQYLLRSRITFLETDWIFAYLYQRNQIWGHQSPIWHWHLEMVLFHMIWFRLVDVLPWIPSSRPRYSSTEARSATGKKSCISKSGFIWFTFSTQSLLSILLQLNHMFCHIICLIGIFNGWHMLGWVWLFCSACYLFKVYSKRAKRATVL